MTSETKTCFNTMQKYDAKEFPVSSKAARTNLRGFTRARHFHRPAANLFSLIYSMFLLEEACHYCGRRLTLDQMTIDHIVPLSRGGGHIPGNVAVCCNDCNQLKGDMLASEFLDWRASA